MNPLRSHKSAPLVYVCQSVVWILYQFLQHFQWRGQVAYKVLHAVCLLRELQALHLCCGRKWAPRGCRWSLGCAGQVWDPHGNQDTQSGHSLPLAMGAPPAGGPCPKPKAAPRSVLCLSSSGEHLLDIYPQFNNAELLILPTGTPPAEARALTGYVIKISTSEKPLCMRWIVRTANRMVWVGRDLPDPPVRFSDPSAGGSPFVSGHWVMCMLAKFV